MKTFLVDFENVHSQGLVGIKDMSDSDRVIILYTEAANNMTVDLHNEIISSKAEVIFKKVYNGSPNALDFQLSSYLGYLICENPKDKYYIVSKDAGYTPVVKFWKSNFDITQIKTIKDEDISILPPVKVVETKVVVEKVKEQTNDKITKEEVANVVKDKAVDQNWIAQTINKYKTKTAINNAIVKKYKSEKAGVIYKAIKPLLKDKK